MSEFDALMRSLRRTGYYRWIQSEEVPVAVGYGVSDLGEIPLSPWRRMSGRGSFIHLYGMEGITGMYVAEIPPGGALEPERHLYEEMICILDGQGATEVWQDGAGKQLFEWGYLSVFAPPLNCWHRLINGGRDPVRFLAVTNAPLILDQYRNPEFVFNCPFRFTDRFGGEEGYFRASDTRYREGPIDIWETNFVPDVAAARLGAHDVKGAGMKFSQFQMAGNSLIGHVGHWPAGRYQKAHYHGPGAVLLGLESEGYVLMWSKELGTRPYQNGHGDRVIELPWKPGGVYCPPGGWFHQHFNTGSTPARHLALRYSGRIFPTGFMLAAKRHENGTSTSIKNGGTMVEYEDEDPEIRRRFERELAARGVPLDMSPVEYV